MKRTIYLSARMGVRFLVISACILLVGGYMLMHPQGYVFPIFAIFLGVAMFLQCFQRIEFRSGTMTYYRPLCATQRVQLAEITEVRSVWKGASRKYQEFALMNGEFIVCSFNPKWFSADGVAFVLDQVRLHSPAMIHGTDRGRLPSPPIEAPKAISLAGGRTIRMAGRIRSACILIAAVFLFCAQIDFKKGDWPPGFFWLALSLFVFAIGYRKLVLGNGAMAYYQVPFFPAKYVQLASVTQVRALWTGNNASRKYLELMSGETPLCSFNLKLFNREDVAYLLEQVRLCSAAVIDQKVIEQNLI